MGMWIVGVTSFLFHRIVHGGSLLVHYLFDSGQLNHSEHSGDERYFDIDESDFNGMLRAKAFYRRGAYI